MYRIIVILTIVVLLLILIINNHSKEKYIGRPSLPLNIPIPENLPDDFMNYVSWENIDWNNIVSHPYDRDAKGKSCDTNDDCMIAEVCIKLGTPQYDGKAGYCQASIQNACIYDAVC